MLFVFYISFPFFVTYIVLNIIYKSISYQNTSTRTGVETVAGNRSKTNLATLCRKLKKR